MNKKRKSNSFKSILLILWVLVIIYFVHFYITSGIPLSEYPDYIRSFIGRFGVWGPFLYIIVYAIRPLIFFPATILTTVSGLLFGPWWGILYTVVGENMSANFAFLLGRYFGRDFIAEREHGLLKKMDGQFRENGFITVLLMRLLYFPFDLTNYLSGLSAVRHRDYALATFIGIIPGLVTFVLLGSSFMNPLNLIFTGLTFVAGIVISYFLKKRHTKFSQLKNLLK
jgi:uncharacterized membrane protein YdjX (TVP38/TMEM64 family)